MSISVMSYVWDHSEFEEGSLLVLLAMADFADINGVCWPSIAQLAKKSRMTDRNVQLCLRKLEEAREIRTIRKGGQVGEKKRASVYQVRTGDNFSPISMTGENCDTRRVKPTSPQPSVEPSIKPPNPLKGGICLEIYQAYPWKVGKPAALRAIAKALKTISHEKLLAKTLAFAKLRKDSINEIPRVPNPATWFNQERYNDDPETWAAAPKANGSRRPGERQDESIDSKIAWREKKKRLQERGLL